MHDLAKKLIDKDMRALARGISYLENDHDDKLDILKDVHDQGKGAHIIGITGSPGAGKSSLVNRFIQYLRSKKLTVGIVAVDPTSPFSGGALLGDRVRMAEHFTDPGVYIRSMGTRGSLGGLARTTKEAIRLMDAYGFDVILVETVGVGQSELDIMKVADTTAVVLNPGSGDVVQVFKAGIMEIADLFIINKADLPGVSKLMTEIEGMLDLVKHDAPWRPPIAQTISTQNKGLAELWSLVEKHRSYLVESGEGERKKTRILQEEVLEVVHYELMKKIEEQNQHGSWREQIERREIDPYTAASSILLEFSEDRNDESTTKEG
ncbi:methylmalonyl Co-A mutase-associated GTPase MeaB [Pseudalkalibacillus berkeleyi]|uniref:Methylmalonyl Co-A mutase-associated GTPase MeaB n=1 Tax=Pseudalkalibacillus berkeleyi TaxID=1069813 RepID=A0ABS9H530_9BACL|nr:methylmalonyl Co-A mutase-associated GTPase MeaB [Pseudalkalibacillus berkeleyi]MCF6138937.1 methylmalonyl Co-A mutase-associated GTPase MeaB [Pseudalkalibacillus berkeleyi]